MGKSYKKETPYWEKDSKIKKDKKKSGKSNYKIKKELDTWEPM